MFLADADASLTMNSYYGTLEQTSTAFVADFRSIHRCGASDCVRIVNCSIFPEGNGGREPPAGLVEVEGSVFAEEIHHPLENPIDESTDSFGCPFDKLYKDQTIRGAGLTVLRKGSREAFLQQVCTPASDRGFAVGVSTLPGHARRIFHEHYATTHVFDHDSVYIRSLGEDYKADLEAPFDFVLLEISPESLALIAEEADLPTVAALNTITAHPDPVLANLGRALIPALEYPEKVSRLFVDQLTAAIGTHVVQQYGYRAVAAGSRPRKLSRAQENVAKSLILDNLHGNVSVADLAQACGLSRATSSTRSARRQA
ncbi:hypothetical protein [Sinorhizobium prairiense]|uniref:hypothetical protein n=1 Tax=Sinorhizobium sp. M103 TaxID=2976821 RepID=UPI0031F2FD17